MRSKPCEEDPNVKIVLQSGDRHRVASSKVRGVDHNNGRWGFSMNHVGGWDGFPHGWCDHLTSHRKNLLSAPDS